MKLILVILFFALIPRLALAADQCQENYFEDKDKRDQAKQTAGELEKLPPLVLDISNPKEALQKLLEEIRELHPDFQNILTLEKMIESGEIDTETAQRVIESYQQQAMKKAEELLEKQRNGTLTPKERKILEGLRILNRKSQQLIRRTSEIQKENEQSQQEEHKEQKQDQRDPSQKDQQDGKQDEESQNNEQQQSSQNQKDKQNSRQQKQDSKQQSQQNQKQENKSDESSKEDLEKQIEDIKKKIEEKTKENQRQQQKQTQQKKQQKKEKDSGKDKNQDEQDQAENGDKSDQDGKQDGGEKEGQGGKEQQGQEGQQQGQEGKQSGKDGKPSDQNSEGEGQQKGKPGQGEGNPSESQSDSQGESGNSAGKEAGNNSLSEKLSEYFKNLLDKNGKAKDSKDKDSEEATSSQEGQGSDKGETSDNKELNKEEQGKRDQAQKERAEKNTRLEEERRKKAEELEKQREANRRAQELKSKMDQMTELQKADFIKTYMDQLWAETLRNYTEHQKLMNSLSHFRSVADSLISQYPQFSFLSQYSKRAHDTFEQLDSAQIQYKSLDHYGVSLIGDEAGSRVLRKLRFIVKVLESLKEVSPLKPDEEIVLNRAHELLHQKKSLSKNYEKELGKAFLSQMVGPLSRLDLQKRFPSTDPREEYNWKAMSQAIKAGELNDLIGFSRMKSYLNMFNRRTFKPKKQIAYTGPKVPVNESEPQLDLADDLDRAPYFYRDGTHPKDDLLRLVSGDMLENIYPDQQIRNNPKQKIPKVVTIIVFDISGSMQGVKDQVRNALIAAYLDKTQIDTITGRADHVYYFIPFDTSPRAAERVGDFAQAREYFNRFRSYPPSGGGGTEITNTLVSVYENIAKHQREGGELDYANILFLTDGEAPLDTSKIKAARDQVNPNVDIILNAITMGPKNEQVTKLATENGTSGEGALGRVFHQHINDEQIKNLLNHKEKIEHLEKVAEDFDSEGDATINRNLLMRFKEEVTKLSTQRELEDRGDAVSAMRLIRALEKPPITQETALQFPMTVFLSTVDGEVSRGWSSGRRAVVMTEFFESVAKIHGISTDQLMESIDVSSRKKLIEWLNKN